jgi:glucose-1-phosphate cytidylyltransferase
MKAVILAGGFGTRLSEETAWKPKPMVEIGGMPILWHIMKIYSAHGIDDFVICCGYKGYVIKEYFANYFLHNSDITFDLKNNQMKVHQHTAEPWRVTLVDTGEKSGTGGRLKRVGAYLDQETFCFTYGDGVGNVDIRRTIAHHRERKQLATMTAVQPPGRFGSFRLAEGQDKITSFLEKPQGDNAWVNGGFFVLEPKVLDYIEEDATFWEASPLERLAREGQLGVFKHAGFWHCMDHLKDKLDLDRLWNEGRAPWKVWE